MVELARLRMFRAQQKKESEALFMKLREIGTNKFYSKNEEIFRAGERAHFLPMVIAGRVKVIRYLSPGKEVILNIFYAGDVFAIPPVIEDRVYPATAIAIEPSELAIVPSSFVRQLIHESESFSRFALENMSRILRETTSSMINLALASPECRVGNVLIRLLEKEKRDAPIRISLRRQDIADMAGLTTETTIRTVKRFEDRKLLRITKGKIIIDDPQRLSDFVGAL